jgi:hypothetical protein
MGLLLANIICYAIKRCTLREWLPWHYKNLELRGEGSSLLNVVKAFAFSWANFVGKEGTRARGGAATRELLV